MDNIKPLQGYRESGVTSSFSLFQVSLWLGLVVPVSLSSTDQIENLKIIVIRFSLALFNGISTFMGYLMLNPSL